MDIGVGHLQDIDQNNDGKMSGLQVDDDLCQRHNLRMRTRIGRKYQTSVTQRVRHKRQTMKGMTKPLKQWLYHHKDYPYPNRKEKLFLSMESTMTLVQVSNWFANARRRLKNTVNNPRMTWEQRIQKYNRHVTGNAERLSISSGDTSGEDLIDEQGCDGFDSDESSTADYAHGATTSDNSRGDGVPGGDNIHQLHYSSPPLQVTRIPSPSSHQTNTNFQSGCFRQSLPTHKYKHSIMQRYLNDSYNHAQEMQKDASRVGDGSSFGVAQPHLPENSSPCYSERITVTQSGQGWLRQTGQEESKFRVAGSVSSHEYEFMSGSPDTTVSLNVGTHRHRHCSEEFSLSSFSDDWTSLLKDTKSIEFKSFDDDEETYWEEIIAAVALTNMARSRQQGNNH